MFIGIVFASEDDASESLEVIADSLELSMGSNLSFTQVSAGRIGDERTASVGTESDDGMTLGYVLARTDRFVAIGVSLGLRTSPIMALSPLVTDIIDAAEANHPSDEQDILECLPGLDGMPPGYAVEEDS
jgi:hypothetical protein